MRIALASLAVALVGCGAAYDASVDGGRTRVVCSTTPDKASIRVVDLAGQPAVGVTVTGSNAGTGKMVSGITDGNGVVSFSEAETGPGITIVDASFNGFKSQGSYTFTCGECSCVLTPSNLVLNLQ